MPKWLYQVKSKSAIYSKTRHRYISRASPAQSLHNTITNELTKSNCPIQYQMNIQSIIDQIRMVGAKKHN